MSAIPKTSLMDLVNILVNGFLPLTHVTKTTEVAENSGNITGVVDWPLSLFFPDVISNAHGRVSDMLI